jgi:hypothetical protein
MIDTYNTAQMAKTWRNKISNTGQANYLAATNTTTQQQIQKQLKQEHLNTNGWKPKRPKHHHNTLVFRSFT